MNERMNDARHHVVHPFITNQYWRISLTRLAYYASYWSRGVAAYNG